MTGKLITKPLKYGPPVKQSSKRASSIAGKYLEMGDHELHYLILTVENNVKARTKLVREIKILAASVLSQRESK